MGHWNLSRDARVATVRLQRGKVNALNPDVVAEAREILSEVAGDDDIGALLITGNGSFFSFGFDIPGFLPYSREAFTAFLRDFTALCTEIFVLAKPVVFALNGHAVAGGCMLAIAGDRRLMARGRAKISLNEITFGASVFGGTVEMLRGCVGRRRAEQILLDGAMYDADAARALGLVDEALPPAELETRAREIAVEMAGRDAVAFAAQKRLLRGPVARRIEKVEEPAIREFVEIWYSPSTRKKLEKIEIRG